MGEVLVGRRFNVFISRVGAAWQTYGKGKDPPS